MEEPAEANSLSRTGLQWSQIIIQSKEKREKKELVVHFNRSTCMNGTSQEKPVIFKSFDNKHGAKFL